MPSGWRDNSRARFGLRMDNGSPAEVFTIQRQNIEGVEPHLVVVPTRLERVEVGDAVDVEHDSLAVDDELPMAVLQRRFDNPRIAIGPVVAAAGDQAHVVPIALQAEAISASA